MKPQLQGRHNHWLGQFMHIFSLWIKLVLEVGFSFRKPHLSRKVLYNSQLVKH